jgi:hypothetical protein
MMTARGLRKASLRAVDSPLSGPGTYAGGLMEGSDLAPKTPETGAELDWPQPTSSTERARNSQAKKRRSKADLLGRENVPQAGFGGQCFWAVSP